MPAYTMPAALLDIDVEGTAAGPRGTAELEIGVLDAVALLLGRGVGVAVEA